MSTETIRIGLSCDELAILRSAMGSYITQLQTVAREYDEMGMCERAGELWTKADNAIAVQQKAEDALL